MPRPRIRGSHLCSYKLKIDACEPGSAKQKALNRIGINYAYRYAMLIVLTAYLLEVKASKSRKAGAVAGDGGLDVTDDEVIDAQGRIRPFAEWLKNKREIRTVLARQTLD
jgi:hypothetical protein